MTPVQFAVLQGMLRRRQVLSVLNFGIKIAGAGVAFLVTVAVTWLLGAASSGQYFALLSVVSITYAVARLGFGYSTFRASAEYSVSDPAKIAGLARWLGPLIAAVSTLAAVTLAIMSGPVCDWLFGDRSAQLTLVVLSLTVPVYCVGSILSEILKGLGLPLQHALFENVSIKLLSLPCLLVGGLVAGQAGIAAGFLFANCAALVLVVALVVRALRPLGAVALLPSEKAGLWATAPYLTALAIWPVALQWLPPIVVSGFASAQDTAMYYVAARTVAVLDLVPVAVAAVWAPAFVKTRTEQGVQAVGQLLWRSMAFAFIGTAALALPLTIWADAVMGLFGVEFQAAAPLLQLMLVVQCLVGPLGLLSAATIAVRRERSTALVAITCVGVLIASLIAGVSILGPAGAVVSTAACTLVFSAWLLQTTRIKSAHHGAD